MTYNLDHYNALKASLYREQERLSSSQTAAVAGFRAANVRAIKKELAGEVEFLKSKGIDVPDDSDDALLDELFS